eukprot:gene1206-11296_t
MNNTMYQQYDMNDWHFHITNLQSVKVFLPNKQIRRFKIMKAKSGFSFEQVKQKIFTYINDDTFDKSKCKFSYLDNDNDWIVFSSTEEFKELTEATYQHTTLRLKVEAPNHTFETELKKQSYEQQSLFHPVLQPSLPILQQPVPFGYQPQIHNFNNNSFGSFGHQQQPQQQQNMSGFNYIQPQNEFNQQNMSGYQQQQQQTNDHFNFVYQQPQTQPQQTQPQTQTQTQPQPQPQQNSNPFNVIPQLQPQKSEESPTIKPVVKTEIKYVCDNCATIQKTMDAIIGTRFHCLICDNFDACEDCFQSIETIHPNHQKYMKINDGNEEDKEIVDLTPKENHSTNPTVEEKPQEEPEEDPQLALLQQMGFTDTTKNIEMLKKHNGNFTNAVQELLTGL